MFCWELEGHYRCTMSMAIAPFWFSTKHFWIVIAPFWLSTDNLWIMKIKVYIIFLFPLNLTFVEFQKKSSAFLGGEIIRAHNIQTTSTNRSKSIMSPVSSLFSSISAAWSKYCPLGQWIWAPLLRILVSLWYWWLHKITTKLLFQGISQFSYFKSDWSVYNIENFITNT